MQIKATKIGGNLYTLEGQGGMIGALVGPDGVFMVDSQFAPLTERIVAAIKQLTDRPIKFLVNTHQHGDHTGGNENFAKLGVTILARDELRARFSQPPAGGRGSAPPAGALPTLTYRSPLDVLHERRGSPAHPGADGAHRRRHDDPVQGGRRADDRRLLPSIQYPNIDRANGGSLKGMIDGLQMVIDEAAPTTKIIPGHGPIVDESAVVAHRALLIAARDKVGGLIKQGMTLEQIVAAKPLAEIGAKVSDPGTTGDRFIGQLYGELGGK